MAVQAPSICNVFCAYISGIWSAGRGSSAADALVHMNLVAEVDEIRQVVHLDPRQRLARCPALAHRLQQLGVGPDLRMTVDQVLVGGIPA